jgi:hydroxymethylpyrimidine/phosphomethylpyrimidine kinase
VDPVLAGTAGGALLDAGGLAASKTLLLPYVFLLTPNLDEAAALAELEIHDPAGMREAARKLAGMGPRAVLVKGGHLKGEATDVLYHRGEWTEFTSPRIETRHTHGTGCTFSAAITASLAAGYALPEAIRRAKRYITEAIRNSPGLGAGAGPLDHHALI